jgi:catechol 2,3-dioxygenase-like lactoylglutathione lyase family enzyme
MNRSHTYGLTHLAIAVRDIDRTLNFYSHVFGMEEMYHEEKMLQLTTPGNNDIIVFEERDQDLIGESGGIAHFGFRAKEPADVLEIHNKLAELKVEIIEEGEFLAGSPYIFFKDPDGYMIEVWYELLPE